MSATNYARNRRTSELVFLQPGDLPRPEHLSPEWAWFAPPKPHPQAQLAMRIGESPQSYESRLRSERS